MIAEIMFPLLIVNTKQLHKTQEAQTACKAWSNWEYCYTSPPPPPGWDASPTQGYPHQYVAGTHLCTWVERVDVKFSFLIKETTWMQGPGLELADEPRHTPETTGDLVAPNTSGSFSETWIKTRSWNPEQCREVDSMQTPVLTLSSQSEHARNSIR